MAALEPENQDRLPFQCLAAPSPGRVPETRCSSWQAMCPETSHLDVAQGFDDHLEILRTHIPV